MAERDEGYSHIANLTGTGPASGPVEFDEDGNLTVAEEDDGDVSSEERFNRRLKELVGDDDDSDDADDSDDDDVDSEEDYDSDDDSDDENRYISREEYDAARREADGRLNQIVALRDENRAISQNMEQLRQILLQQYQEQSDDQEEELPENLANHAGIRYMKNRLDRLDERLNEGSNRQQQIYQQQMQQQQIQQEFQKVAEYTNQKKEEFSEKHKDFDDAYEFARNARKAFLVGVPEEHREVVLNNEETQLAMRAMQMGQNPAQQIYEMAKQLGWNPKKKKAKKVDPNRVKSGLKSSRTSTLTGGRGKRGGRMNAKQFLTQLPKAERLRVLSDPELFEQLARTGHVSL